MLVTLTIIGHIAAGAADRLRARRGAASAPKAAERALLPPPSVEQADGVGLETPLAAIGAIVLPEAADPTEIAPAAPLACHRFQIQFLGGRNGEGPAILGAAEVQAPNVFAAFRASDPNAWPRGATGFRIVDSRGRKVFWRRKPGADRSHEFHLHFFSDDASAEASASASSGRG